MPAVHIRNKPLFNQLLAIAEQLNLSDLEEDHCGAKAPNLPKPKL